MEIKYSIVRIASYILILIGIVLLLAIDDVVSYSKRSSQKETEVKHDDYYTFESLGLEVAIYDPSIIHYEKDHLARHDEILLVRTSLLPNNVDVFNQISETPFNATLLLCDSVWSTDNMSCTPENFISEDPDNNLIIVEDENLSVGYIKTDTHRIFIIPIQLLQNLPIYPKLADLIGGISHAQHIQKTEINNLLEIQNKAGLPFFVGEILFILIFNSMFVIILHYLLTKFSARLKINSQYSPFLGIIPTTILLGYILANTDYLDFKLEAAINMWLGFELEIYPSILMLFLAGLILLFVFYIGFEIYVIYSRYATSLRSYITQRSNTLITRYTLAVLLSVALIQLSKNSGTSIPNHYVELTVFSFFLFLLYIAIKSNPENSNKIVSMHRLANLLNKKIILYVSIFIYTLAVLAISIFFYLRSASSFSSKNAIFFNPPRDYVVTPYNKIIRDGEIYHEYMVSSPEPIWINNYLISHPNYEIIKYSSSPQLSPSQAIGYNKSDEPNVIKSLLASTAQIESYITETPSQYFVLANKLELETKVTIKLDMVCNNVEKNSSVFFEKFRLSYDRQDVVYFHDELHTKRKCTYDEPYSLTIIRNLNDLTSYSYSDQIIKLSADNKILGIEIIYDDPTLDLKYLNLVEEKGYIWAHFSDQRQITILSNSTAENNLEFKSQNGSIDMASSINELKLRQLIPAAVTIDSLNKYTLIKYIK